MYDYADLDLTGLFGHACTHPERVRLAFMSTKGPKPCWLLDGQVDNSRIPETFGQPPPRRLVPCDPCRFVWLWVKSQPPHSTVSDLK